MEIWCECFGKSRESIKKADSYEIEGILNIIGGWVKYDGNKTGKKAVSMYGVQRVFVRAEWLPTLPDGALGNRHRQSRKPLFYQGCSVVLAHIADERLLKSYLDSNR